MSYETASLFAQTWGLAFLILLFLAAVGYAMWPGNRGTFRRAARLPLDEAAWEPGRRHQDSVAKD